MANNNVLVIRSEADAFAYLERALKEEFADRPVRIEFKNWPVLTIRLEGSGYDSTITPDMAEALVALQQAINRTYARSVHHTTTARSLTNEEKQRLQFKAKVAKGSSLIEINLGEFFETLGLNVVSKMSSTDVVITVLGLAAVGASLLAYKAFLRSRTEGKTLEEEARAKIALSQEETKRMEIMGAATRARPEIDYARQDFDAARREILRGTADAKTLTVQGVPLERETARVIAAATRSESREVQLNGPYRLNKIDWQQQDDVVRIWLAGTDNGRQFVATLKVDEIDEDQRTKLQKAEWERRIVYLSINAAELRGEITTAAIVGVEWPKEG